jgi:hypothetical protein
MAAKYAICPGPVRSKVDGDVHHIDAATLMRLYRVPPQDCVVITPTTDPETIRLRTNAATVFLHPDFYGNYTLPNLKAKS